MKNKSMSTYILLIYIVSILCFYKAFAYLNFSVSFDFIGIIIFSLLSIITESLLVTFKRSALSSGFAITFASILLFQPFISMLVVSLGIAFKIVKKDDKIYHLLNIPFYKTLFNISNIAISTFFASVIYNYLSTINSLNIIILKLLQFISVSLIFLVVNSLIMSILFAIITHDNFIKVFWNNFKFGSLGIIAMAPFGYLLSYLYQSYNIMGIIIVMIPVLFARYTYILYIESKSKYMETVKVLMHALESRDAYTEGHSRNVAKYVEIIARELKYSDSKIEELILAAYLHDVGKIGISDAILNKPGKLTEEEYSIIKTHPVIGYNIVNDIKDLGNIPEIVRHHHEKYDGTGYPDKKGGDELSLDVYILQLADAVDAMATNRVYRKALTWEKIREELIKFKGIQFHPVIVDAFLRACEKQNNCIERG